MVTEHVLDSRTWDMLAQQAMLKTAPYSEMVPCGRLSTESMLGTRDALEQLPRAIIKHG